jgi:hypothetical protein
MNEFLRASEVELEALFDLLPFIAKRSERGEVVLTAPFKYVQKAIGDALARRNGHTYSIEIKAERRFTGNVFLETFSNKPVNDGWMYTTCATEIWFYFLANRSLNMVNTAELREWAFGKPGTREQGRLAAFEEVPQQQYDQRNYTHGRIVPIRILQAEVASFRSASVPRLSPGERMTRPELEAALRSAFYAEATL